MVLLGDRIKTLRLRKGITQTELAAGLVTPSMISQLEANKVMASVTLMIDLAARLEVSVEEFLEGIMFPYSERDYLDLANSFYERNEKEAAGVLYRHVVATHSGMILSPHTLYQVGERLNEIKDYSSALKPLDWSMSIIQGRGTDREYGLLFDVYMAMGWAYRKLQQMNLAYHYWEKADSLLEGNIEVEAERIGQLKNRLGEIDFYRGDFEKAHKRYQDALEHLQVVGSQEKIGLTLKNLGITYKYLGEFQPSKESFEASIDLLKKSEGLQYLWDAQVHYGQLIASMGDVEKAIELFRGLANTGKDQGRMEDAAWAYLEIATVQLQSGQAEKARETLTESLALLPFESSLRGYVLSYLAKAYHKLNQLEDAIGYYQESVKELLQYSRYHDLFNVHRDLANCYKEKGDYEQATEVLSIARTYGAKLIYQ